MATIGETLRAVVSYSHPNGSVAQNVFWYQVNGEDADDAVIFAALAIFFENVFLDQWNNFISVTVAATGLEVDVIDDLGLVVRNVGSTQFNVPGGQAGQAVSSGVAAYMQAYTDVPKAIGKKYMPGMDELVVDDGALNSLALADLAVLATLYVFGIDYGIAGQLIAGVLSRKLATFVPFNGNTVVTDIPAYQRRRKEGVGS